VFGLVPVSKRRRNYIRMAIELNIQDASSDSLYSINKAGPTIGNNVSIGHNALVSTAL